MIGWVAVLCAVAAGCGPFTITDAMINSTTLGQGLPTGFMLGAATSAFQTEGGLDNDWTQWALDGHSKGDVVGNAVDSWNQFTADKGLNQLLVFRFDAKTGQLTPNNTPPAMLPPGSGPRHYAFHPSGRWVFTINEQGATITTFAWDAKTGGLTMKGSVPTRPADVKSGSTAEIHVHKSGRFVYGSNRGHDSIAVFSVGNDGALTLVEYEPTRGQAPRNFSLDPSGRWLVGVRHQVHDEPDAAWLLRPDVQRGLQAVQRAGLAYDLLLRPREIPAAVSVARALPELRLVVDHIAKPEIAEIAEGFAALSDQYLAARADDIREVGDRLIRNLTQTPYAAFAKLPPGTVVIAEELYRRFPEADEGDLSRLRSRLVSAGPLARIGAAIGIGSVLRLGSGELRTGGYRRESILADATEALFGAAYLDGNLEEVRELVLRLYQDMLAELQPDADLKDSKTRLQEHLQANGWPLPVYTVKRTTGEPHAQVFLVSCAVPHAGIETEGEGPSRRRAEQVAAQAALVALGLHV